MVAPGDAAGRKLQGLCRALHAPPGPTGRKKVIIFGARDSGNLVLREILNNDGLRRRPLGFIDDGPAQIGRLIDGHKVLGNRHDPGRAIREKEADEVIVAASGLSVETRRYIEGVCKEMRIAVIRVPGIFNVDR